MKALLKNVPLSTPLTESREAEGWLEERESCYGELGEFSHDMACHHDLHGRIVEVNAATVRAMDMPADELCTMNVRDILDADAVPLFEQYLADIARDGAAEGLMAVRTRSHERRVWHYRNTLITTDAGTPSVRGIARDVTDREDALSALRSSEHHFRSLIENTSDIIAIVGEEGLLEYHSPSAERLLGYSHDELTGRPIADLVHAEDRAAAGELLGDAEFPATTAETHDVRVRHCDGSWRWLSIAARRMSGGRRMSILVNARDITDSRRLKSQLEQAQRLSSLGRLAATVAHEFNNVLMGMQPFAELLQRPGTPAETMAKCARHIASSIARGKHVALDILRFTQPAEPAIQPFDLREWWDRFSPEIYATTRNDIVVEASFPESLTVAGDPTQLGQLIGNLINNARDAMPVGGELRVEARAPRAGETFPFGVVLSPETFVEICVSDTGTGMTPHVKEHAFDPLFTTKRNGGTGLGLAVAHQVVTRHAGSIFVESEVGAGTTFHVFLPRAAKPPAVTEAVAERAQINATRVLLVEDEPGIAAGLADLFDLVGLETAVAATGELAEPMARTFRPDVVLVDVGLPDIDGFEVGRRLRAAWPSLNIVFISGHGDARDVPSVDPNMAFLQKPFTVEALLAKIAGLETRSRP